MAAELEFLTQGALGCMVAQPAGEVDLSNSAELREHLCGLVERGHLIVDLSLITFIDSTGLSAILVAHRRGRERGHQLRLARAQGQVRRILEITQLDLMVDIHHDIGDAIEAMSPNVDAAG